MSVVSRAFSAESWSDRPRISATSCWAVFHSGFGIGFRCNNASVRLVNFVPESLLSLFCFVQIRYIGLHIFGQVLYLNL